MKMTKMPMDTATRKKADCSWCGTEMRQGFHICPNCQRVQHAIFGRLQILNAPSWLAVIVAITASIFSWQQNDLVRTQVGEARKERLRAEDALKAAEEASDNAENAGKSAQGALEDARRARDDAEAALNNARQALLEVGAVEDHIGEEAAAVRRLLINLRTLGVESAISNVKTCHEVAYLKAVPLYEGANVQIINVNPPKDTLCRDQVNSANQYYIDSYDELLLFKLSDIEVKDLEAAFCKLETLLSSIDVFSWYESDEPPSKVVETKRCQNGFLEKS